MKNSDPHEERPRVLVIDDDLGPRESLRILLKPDYDVSCADSVARGLDLLREQAPDIVISDIRMPGVNGIEGLRMIREIDSDVPVIMLTGYGALETAQEAIRHGASDYMKKPFDASNMLDVIRRNVERSHLIRRRKQNLLNLQEMNQQLLDDMAAKNRLASLGQASAELMHDLRNPMMVILGYVQLLSREVQRIRPASEPGGGDDEVEELMGVIEQNVHRCKELIDLWQDLSRNRRPQKDPISLHDVIETTADACRPLAENKRAAIECRLPPGPIPVLGHAVQLGRAVQNLASNSIDAVAGDGTGLVTIACEPLEDGVRVSVHDNGTGIKPEDLPRVQEPFYTRKAAGGGSGLGLFISRSIIEEHGGTLTIDSVWGKGTCASFVLPARGASE
jgi:signal transduction histidine kinase